MKIAITGGSGYVGSFLATRLIELTDNEIENIDIKDGKDYREFTNYSNFDVVIHLAGHSSVRMSLDDPEGAWQNNVVGFDGLVGKLHENQLLISASSASIYGRRAGIASEGLDFSAPTNVYDLSKMCTDLIAAKGVNEGKKIVSLRFGTIAGSSPNMRWDLIVNKMLKDAITQGCIQVVNPEVRRGILFLEDLFSSVQKIIERPVPGIFNLVSLNTTVGEIGKQISEFTGAKINTEDYMSNKLYDFHLSNELFVQEYGSYQSATLLSILKGIQSEYFF